MDIHSAYTYCVFDCRTLPPSTTLPASDALWGKVDSIAINELTMALPEKDVDTGSSARDERHATPVPSAAGAPVLTALAPVWFAHTDAIAHRITSKCSKHGSKCIPAKAHSIRIGLLSPSATGNIRRKAGCV